LKGAALATATGRGLGVLYQLWHLFKATKTIRLKVHHFSIDWGIIRGLFKISWVGFIQFSIASASWIFLTRIMSSFGDDAAIAGYGVAMRIVMFFLLPAWGLSNAAATLVGQNLGAGHPERAEKSVLTTARYNAIFMVIVTIIFWFLGGVMVRFMNSDVAVEGFAIQALQVISTGYVFYGIGMVLINAFNGAGDTTTPTIVNLFGFWFFQIPFAWFLAKASGMGPLGVFIAIPVAETLMTVASWILFKRGKWKTVKV
jgi:Na+-driven multidrug efflux pump